MLLLVWVCCFHECGRVNHTTTWDQPKPTIAVSDRDGALAEIGFSDERVDEHRVSLASVALQQLGGVSGGGGG